MEIKLYSRKRPFYICCIVGELRLSTWPCRIRSRNRPSGPSPTCGTRMVCPFDSRPWWKIVESWLDVLNVRRFRKWNFDNSRTFCMIVLKPVGDEFVLQLLLCNVQGTQYPLVVYRNLTMVSSGRISRISVTANQAKPTQSIIYLGQPIQPQWRGPIKQHHCLILAWGPFHS